MAIQELLERIDQLPIEEQRTLLDHLRQSVGESAARADDSASPGPSLVPSLVELKARMREAQPGLAARYHLSSLALFGSYVRGEAGTGSDLDLLATFTRTPTLLDLARLQDELADLLGLPVDVVPADSLRPELAPRILAEAVAL